MMALRRICALAAEGDGNRSSGSPLTANPTGGRAIGQGNDL